MAQSFRVIRVMVALSTHNSALPRAKLAKSINAADRKSFNVSVEPAPASGAGFGAEHPWKTRTGETHADHFFAVCLRMTYVHYLALSFEIGTGAGGHVGKVRDANLQIGTDGDIETSAKRCPTAAHIFAGSFFLEGKSACVAAADSQRQAYGDSTFGPL